MTDTLAIQRASDASGAYERVEKGLRPLRRYTVFVRFTYEDDESTDGSIERWSSIEEIDVNAEDESDAWIIAGQALVDDYEEGGHIVRAEERIGWYL